MMTAPTFKPDDIELIPDSWERFERAVDTVSKSGPQPRAASPRKQSKGTEDPSGERYEEWGVYVEPDTPAESSSGTSARRMKQKRQWVPHGRSFLSSAGELQIEFLR
jgi:hypothetical protein